MIEINTSEHPAACAPVKRFLLVIITPRGTWFYDVENDADISERARAFDGSNEARVFVRGGTTMPVFIGQLREATTVRALQAVRS